MKFSPLFLAIVYAIMGVLFMYIAIETAEETIWNFMTILFAAIATIDFIVAFRMIGLHNASNKKK
ncbi:YdiK family protein [Halalkalibacillus halophilus]|uniref:YdiK family protein n=1 Tax=Halalkalibacillus halophilus TaxID=392827 RepID=UPI0004090DB0|nr:YdiK family protein [Halalkalibacillus halophilus]